MATEHAIITERPMELPSLPPNQGLEAVKDIVFGSVRSLWLQERTDTDEFPGGRNGRQTY
jgi:hypothetical protein